MSSNNPTGMGNATAARFRKVARDIEMYNKYNQSDNYDHRHQSNKTTYATKTAPSLLQSFMFDLFNELFIFFHT